MITLVIADDHHLVRQGLRALLEQEGDMRVVGEAADGPTAVQLVEKMAPDILITDVAMPQLNGVLVTERVCKLGNKTRVMVLSMYADETLVRQALQGGAHGYLLKSSVAEELLLAVHAVYAGEVYLCPPISRMMVSNYLSPQAGFAPLAELSPREREVWQLIAEGHTNPAIAQLLHLSVKTVEKHRASLMSKLNVHDVTALVRLAVKHGLIPAE